MATIKRAKGQSKREAAAAAQGAKLNYRTGAVVKPKLTVAPKPKAVSPLVGAGPLMTGQSRVSSQGPAIGPLLENQSRPTQKSTSSNRSQAAKAFSSKKSTTFNDLTSGFKSGGLTWDNAPKTPTLSGPTTLSQGKAPGIFGALKNKAMGLMADIGQSSYRNGAGMMLSAPATADQRVANRQMIEDATIGIPTANASNIPDFPTGAGDNGELFFNGNEQMGPSRADFMDPETNRMRGDFNPRRSNPFGIPTVNAADESFIDNRRPNYDINPEDNPDTGNRGAEDFLRYGGGVPTQDEITQRNNDLNGGGPGPVDAPFGTQANRSGRGNGAFGTGKGLQGEDPYLQEMRKSLKGYGRQEKDVMGQFEDLIKSLDPTYNEYQNDAKRGVDEELNQNLVRLAAVMNANNTGDSEQRAQLMSGQQRDATARLADLFRKLALDKQEKITGYRTQGVNAVNSIRERKQGAQEKIAQLMRDAQSTQGVGGRKVSSPTSEKLSRNDIFNWTEDALNKGYSWQEIAENAKEQGIGTETGGYLDQLLNNANKQKRYR